MPMRRRNFIVSTLLSVRRDPLLPILSKIWKKMVLLIILSLLLPLLPRLLLYNSWLPIQDVLLESISETTECTLLLSMTIFLNKQSLTDKCLFFWEGLQEERPTQETSFISTPVFWRELPRWTRTLEEDPWPPYQSLKHKQVMSQPIFQPTSSLSLTDRSSWKPNCSTKVSDPPSTSDYQSAESDQQLKSKLWSKLLVS